MPIKQLFLNGTIKLLGENESMAPVTCNAITKDAIDWTDAETLVHAYQTFLKNNRMGKALSFALTQNSINALLGQGDLDSIKIYLAYSEADKTIRAFAVAAKLNTTNGEYDDFNIPVDGKSIDLNTMPKLENVRPCPHQCGIVNILNRDIYS